MARTSKAAAARAAAAAAAETVSEKVVDNAEPVVETKKANVKVKELKPTDYITVRNGFAGKLIYVSKRTGEQFIWDAFGDEQDMELQELKNARNSAKGFFENNWFLFDDPAVISYLGVERMYANALSVNDFDGLFKKTPGEIEDALSRLPSGQKTSLAYYARQKIIDHEIDSLRVIELLEKYLNVQLIER